MTTTHAQSSDRALAALALVEAISAADVPAIRSIVSTTPNVELLSGMTTLVSSLTVSLAAATGVQPADITGHLRHLLYVHAEMEDV